MIRLIAMLLLSLVWVAPIAAQDDTTAPEPGDPQNLLNLLTYVPATPDVLENYLTYNDIRAAEASREGIGQYDTFAEFLDDDTLSGAVWLQSYPAGGFEDIPQSFLIAGEGMPQIVGFDFMDIDRMLQFNRPPSIGLVIQGDFDAASIDTAHTNRDYLQLTLGDTGWPLWCETEACEGFETNRDEIERANIFGGNLGRKWPVALNPDENVILSSADGEQVEAMGAGSLSDEGTLASLPDYRAAVNALGDYGLLRATYIVPGATLGAIDVRRLLSERATAEQVDELSEEFGLNTLGDGLPPYSLVIIADMGTLDGQTAVIGLVYDNEADAETALDVIPGRLSDIRSLIRRQPWSEMIEERDMTLTDPQIVATDDRYVAVFPFEYPSALNDVEFSPGRRGSQTAGLGYRLFLDAFIQRDLVWLAYDTDAANE